MAAVPPGSNTFFRLGPAAAKCFAVRRGETNRRYDPQFHATPDMAAVIESRYPNTQTLGAFCEFIDSGKPIPPRLSENGIPAYEVGHILPRELKDTATFVSDDSGKVLQRHDLITGRVGGLGAFAEYNSDLPASFSDNILRLRPKEHEKQRAAFVAEYLNSSIGNTQLIRGSRGSLQKVVTQKSLGEIVIPMLGQRENELVAAMDAARAERKGMLAEADGLLAGIDGFVLEALGIQPPPADARRVFAVNFNQLAERLDSEFNHPRYKSLAAVLDKASTETTELDDILVSISSGATPNRNDASLYTESGIKFLRILNIENGEINYRDLKHISDAVHEGQLSRSQLAVDDVLMTITGRVGSAAVVQAEHLPANINQHIVRMRVDQDRCLSEFLAIWLNSKPGLAISNRLASGGTRAALDYNAIRKIRIPLPASLETQESIVNQTKEIRQEARRLRTAAEACWQAAKRRFEDSVLL